MSLQPPPQGSTKLHLKAPWHPVLLLPYKRAGLGSIRERGEKQTDKARRKPEATLKRAKAHHPQINISSNLLVLSLSL
jgi:hypothetical protein